MTTVYFLRHSETLKTVNVNNNDPLQLQNEKWPLTINGENIAKEKSKRLNLKLDCVYSSNYVRAISTAKYFTNNIIYIDESFGERKFGVNDFSQLPPDFAEKQFTDFDYKLDNGESLNEVISRENKALTTILQKHKNQNIMIVGHSTAFAALLSVWCDINVTGNYKFKDEIFFDGKWIYCEMFKLTFDENNQLVKINNIK